MGEGKKILRTEQEDSKLLQALKNISISKIEGAADKIIFHFNSGVIGIEEFFRLKSLFNTGEKFVVEEGHILNAFVWGYGNALEQIKSFNESFLKNLLGRPPISS